MEKSAEEKKEETNRAWPGVGMFGLRVWGGGMAAILNTGTG